MATAPPQIQYETVIGLEVHVQLKTDSKLFDPSPNSVGDEPNVNLNTPTMGLPGALPVLNEKAVEYAIRLGLALNCQIAEVTKFDRKQYFYPDMPKNYQISQYDYPICHDGHMVLSNGRHVRILRAHLEEDAGKLVHAGAAGLAGSEYSLVDLNRSGCPLLEIVSEPDMRSAEEAREYMQNVRNIVRYVEVSDANLEEGTLRCDANVSIRPVGSEKLGVKTEIKNMNSFRSVQRAIEVEVARQIEVLSSGGTIIQETRLWDEGTQSTKSMRSKEEAHDYRYFPDPDLRPLAISRETVEEFRKNLPELPLQRHERLISQFGLGGQDANFLVETKAMGDFFLQAAAKSENYKALANWIQGDIAGYLNANKLSITETRLTPDALAELVQLVDKGTVSNAIAKKLLPDLLEKGGNPESLVQERGLTQVSDEGALRAAVQKVIDANPAEAEAFRGGKDKLMGFFVGQVMKETKGSANPQLLNQLIREMLS